MRYPSLGAFPAGSETRFRVWAPRVERLHLVIENGPAFPMTPQGAYFEGTFPDLGVGTRYRYRVDGASLFPDPASRFQPTGVHGPSEIIDPTTYPWTDSDWRGIPRADLVFYELHVGSFSPEGTFEGVRSHLEYLKDLGITAIELMPLADFPGDRNWGYDPGALYAPSRAYGRPDALRRLIDDAHRVGLAVFLDVIYNHLGPDGAYVAAFGPMFTERHETPWGSAINLDDRDSEGVRALLIDNALHWLREYHLDGLRLDATHALIDDSPVHFLAELSQAVELLDGPRRYLIAEDPRNVNTVVRSRAEGGYGLDAIWTDDFHHQIRNMTAGDRESYYADYHPSTMRDVAVTVEQGWFYDGRPSRVTRRSRGTSAEGVGFDQCVICIQNHDQVGNRPLGSRLHHEIEPHAYRAVSALFLFLPHLPLLFMGQEWAASSPFQFFTDHDEELGRLVTEGRRAEFQSFSGFHDEVPDPQDRATFEASRLRWEEAATPPHVFTSNLYRDLLALRGSVEGRPTVAIHSDTALTVTRGRHHLVVTLDPATALPLPDGATIIFHTEQPHYTADSVPPESRNDVVRFRRAGALVARSA